ncbi:MAG: 4Fe-4S dicluster domain-containing protein [Planctomycetota bacterium]|jgi:Fe-S-cluster-containing hydrogenase component 2
MADSATHSKHKRWFLPKEALDTLVQLLCGEGYTVIAPTLRDGVISMQPIRESTQIARGVTDEHDGGRYRTTRTDEGFFFHYVVGPDGPKRYFFPPQQKLFTISVQGERFDLKETGPKPPKLAFIGIRACELAAIAVQDRVLGGESPQEKAFRCETDNYYRQAREQALLIAVNCTHPGGTCFCASWDTGPEVTDRHVYDISLTELRAGFILRIASERGFDLVQQLPVREPTAAELDLEELQLLRATERMGRSLKTSGVKELLDRTIDHPRWERIAERCLSCGNCTMVCPTCFCSTVTDTNDLATGDVTRTREWESCYTHQFSYTTGSAVRVTARARYRHWLRHKLCTWWDQFDTSGCVGCGRCITWCPVGIDLTEEVTTIRNTERSLDPVGPHEQRPSLREELEVHP